MLLSVQVSIMTVWQTFQAHTGRQIDKWRHYFPVYESYFARFVNTSVRVLEVGVDHGGSLQLWKSYFGSRATIIGIDIDPICKDYQEEQIGVIIADQKNPALAHLNPFDIIIDDGSHLRTDQEVTFRHLWPKCKGVYLIEDCHGLYPKLDPQPPLTKYYPWMVVCEREQRIIKGSPSRPLRDDEKTARELYGV
jgi:hypothetical protein